MSSSQTLFSKTAYQDPLEKWLGLKVEGDISQLITKVKTYLDNTLLLRDFNTALSANDRYSKHNITKETRALNGTLDQMDFTDIYRTLHPNTTEYTFFSSARGTFSRIDHILGHKSGLC